MYFSLFQMDFYVYCLLTNFIQKSAPETAAAVAVPPLIRVTLILQI